MSVKDDCNSIELVKHAENLLRESYNLLKEIKGYIINPNKSREIDILKDTIDKLKLRNDNLYMENVLLKSKVRELIMMIDCNQNKI